MKKSNIGLYGNINIYVENANNVHSVNRKGTEKNISIDNWLIDKLLFYAVSAVFYPYDLRNAK